MPSIGFVFHLAGSRAGPAHDGDDTQPMDLDTPIADIFNLEMPVDDDDDDGEEIPSTQPDLDDGDDREEESEPPKASESGWET